MLTMADRVEAFKAAYAKWPASWPHLVTEQGRDVLYATWLIGNDYRASAAFYGQYPPGYLARVMALFPPAPRTLRDRGVDADAVLHVFSGSLPPGPYTRLDINPALEPDRVGSVYDVAKIFLGRRRFRLIVADPPYSAADAQKYSTAMIDRKRAIASLASVAKPGAHMVWL